MAKEGTVPEIDLPGVFAFYDFPGAARCDGAVPSSGIADCTPLGAVKSWVQTEFASDAGQAWYRLLFDETPVSTAGDPVLLDAKTVGDARLVALQALLRSAYWSPGGIYDRLIFDECVDGSSSVNEEEPETEKKEKRVEPASQSEMEEAPAVLENEEEEEFSM